MTGGKDHLFIPSAEAEAFLAFSTTLLGMEDGGVRDGFFGRIGRY
jgi:hypothetical protein